MQLFRSKKTIIAIFAVLTVGLSIFWFTYYRGLKPNNAEKDIPFTTSAAEEKPAEGVLELIVLSEPVYIKSPEATEEAQIVEAVQIKKGTTVITGETGRAELRYPNKSVTRLNYNSEVVIKEITVNPQNSLLQLIKGSIWNRVSKLFGKDTFSTETGTMVATVRGTAYRMGILEDGTNVLMVEEGEVAVDIEGEEDQEMIENKRMLFNPETDEDPLIEDFDVEGGADDWTLFNMEQDQLWMEENKDKFPEENVLGESTENTDEEGNVIVQNVSPTPVLIDCTGPDGVLFKASKLDCDNLNNFWKEVNPPKNNSSNNSGTGPTATPVPATPTATPTPTPTLEPEKKYEIFVRCIKINGDGTYHVSFGYRISGTEMVNLFISKFEGALAGNPPASLQPDSQEDVIAIVKQDSTVTWIADNETSTATMQSPQCDAPPAAAANQTRTEAPQ